MVGTITDKQRTPHRHESGHRCSSHVSTSADMRTRGVKSSGGHESTPVTGRPAGAAAGDAPTVTRHAVERKEVIVVLAISGAHFKWEVAKASVHLLIQFHTCLSRRSRGHTHHRLQWKAASIQVGKELTNFGPESVMPMEVAQSHTRATLSFRAAVVTVESLDASSKTVDTRTQLLRWMREILSKQV